MTKQKQKAIVLVSGGPDSATLIGWALKQNYEPTLVNFQFGLMTDRSELTAARAVAKHYGIGLDVIDMKQIVGMLGHERPTIHSEAHVMKFGSAILMSIASCYAILKKCSYVLVALHNQDAEESPEYRQPFLDKINEALNMSTESNDIKLLAPFTKMEKEEVLKLGFELGVPLHKTWSCIVSDKIQCGGCGACRARRNAMEKAGIKDITKYKF
ncbi:7-cyano-7-deazaguanine synthase [Runella salmonicolor]|uniref:7-cyano-7-deazaguanine synthase n=1 Tax=Runella salmonicolor TaxID=2950278 RepID=A0ABT1FVF7_9BACT|nr:7-cyano-7-deazaguanine synthase [Runella salmonicolor]MCP1384467.1 7-cyano-7-deazaguanine synthase [Runella salmonicolor]